MFLLDLMLQNAGLGACPACAGSGFQAPNGYERMYAPVAKPSFVPCDLFDHCSGSPEVGLEAYQEASKTCRRYSNDVVVHAIQYQSFSDNRGIRTEVPAPESRGLCIQISRSSSGALTPSGGRSSKALTKLNTVVFRPMPSANAMTTAAVEPGFLRSMRTAKSKSRHSVSTRDSQPPERTTSFIISRLPRSRRTVRTASLRLIPSFIFSAASISK